MEESDEALMTAYVGGDMAAFRKLFDRHAPSIRALMRRGFKYQDEVEDLVQQTFLQLHRARNDYREGARVRGWLVTIALNLKRSRLRRPVRRSWGGDVDELASPVDDAAPDRALLTEHVREAIRALPEGQRRVIELHWIEGKSFPEVAKVMGASVSAVKVRAHRAYGTLREILGDVEDVTKGPGSAYSGTGEDES
ncbi:MAG: RNA polymerase sigma factor [Polyangiales bacterium]